jgi:formyltetrahydrofolate dehydrogenase
LKFEDGKMIPASKYGQSGGGAEDLKLSDEELKMQATIKTIWQGILATEDIQPDMDFFGAGAGSMDVTR